MTLLEVLVVIAAFGLAAIILTPSFSRCACHAGRVNCGNNMGQLHKAMTMYESDYSIYPTRAAEGKNPLLDGDAQEALNLLYRQYIDDTRVFSCPRKKLPPTLLAKIDPSSPTNWPGAIGTYFHEALPGATNGFSTSFGYSPGHTSINSRVVILADHKGVGPKGNSDNHGADAGQFCLTAGGSVGFVTTVFNPLGTDDDRTEISDPDIFSSNPIQLKYPDWDSFCR